MAGSRLGRPRQGRGRRPGAGTAASPALSRSVTLAGVALVLGVIAEITLFVVVAHFIGVPATVLLVVATSVAGGWLLAREGTRGWRAFRSALDERRPPGRAASDGLVGLVAALLLVLPGFITDAVGLTLLLPPVRALARGLAQRVAERHVPPVVASDLFGPRQVRTRRGPARGATKLDEDEQGSGSAGPGEVVEGEIIDRGSWRADGHREP